MVKKKSKGWTKSPLTYLHGKIALTSDKYGMWINETNLIMFYRDIDNKSRQIVKPIKIGEFDFLIKEK